MVRAQGISLLVEPSDVQPELEYGCPSFIIPDQLAIANPRHCAASSLSTALPVILD